jgi:erythromycin esterase-like protein
MGDSSRAPPPRADLFAFSLADARRAVDAIPPDRRLVLLGESTHGSEEFYRVRVEMTKRLIEERGFEAVGRQRS